MAPVTSSSAATSTLQAANSSSTMTSNSSSAIKPVNKIRPIRKNKENRKIPKPLIERKRRARINTSLQELEKLLGELTGIVKTRKNGKLEKADILEVAVSKMKELDARKRESSALFVKGFQTCFNEVKLFFTNNDLEWGDAILAFLSESMRQQLNSLGFCSVIRHTNELQNNGITSSTIESQTSHSNDHQKMDTNQCPTVIQEADSASVWRPWFANQNLVTN